MENEKLVMLSEALSHSLFKNKRVTTTFKLNIADFDNDIVKLNKLINKLEDACEGDEIEVRISSYGGSVEEFNQIKNTIDAYFYGRCTTILNPTAYSAGACCFLIGNKRVVYENSNIMFHDVSLGTVGKHSDVKNQSKFYAKYFDDMSKRELSPYFSDEEIQRLLSGEEFWFDALEMCKRKIATHVHMFGVELEASAYIEYCENPKNRKVLLEMFEKRACLPNNDLLRVKHELSLLNEETPSKLPEYSDDEKTKNSKSKKEKKNKKA